MLTKKLYLRTVVWTLVLTMIAPYSLVFATSQTKQENSTVVDSVYITDAMKISTEENNQFFVKQSDDGSDLQYLKAGQMTQSDMMAGFVILLLLIGAIKALNKK